jgi:hypothetical protein
MDELGGESKLAGKFDDLAAGALDADTGDAVAVALEGEGRRGGLGGARGGMDVRFGKVCEGGLRLRGLEDAKRDEAGLGGVGVRLAEREKIEGHKEDQSTSGMSERRTLTRRLISLSGRC